MRLAGAPALVAGGASGLSSLPGRVDIREVGPRDGLQLEAPLSFSDKARLITALAEAGVGRCHPRVRPGRT